MNIKKRNRKAAGRSYPDAESSLLRRLFQEAGSVNKVNDRNMLVIAVHAVMLDAGFVGFDPGSGSGTSLKTINLDGFGAVTVFYTLPRFLGSQPAVAESESVKVTFKRYRNVVTVCGSLCSGGWRSCMLKLKVGWFGRVFREGLRKFKAESVGGSGRDCDDYRGLAKFLRTPKDNLANPLLIDLIDENELSSTPCFMSLPADVKLMILRKLRAHHVAKVACVSKEMRALCSNNDLLKRECERLSSSQGTKRKKHKYERAFEYDLAFGLSSDSEVGSDQELGISSDSEFGLSSDSEDEEPEAEVEAVELEPNEI